MPTEFDNDENSCRGSSSFVVMVTSFYITTSETLKSKKFCKRSNKFNFSYRSDIKNIDEWIRWLLKPQLLYVITKCIFNGLHITKVDKSCNQFSVAPLLADNSNA